LDNEEKKIVTFDLKMWERIYKVITDYPELGYKTVDEFINDAAVDLLNLTSQHMTHLQTWRKR
jgi:hypothetical protein